MKHFFIILLLIPAVLFGALTFDSNHKKEIALLNSFDIDPSFLNDPLLISMKEDKQARYQKEHFFQAMEEAYLFIPMVKRIISESNVPAEFLFLAMAESNFSTKAYSSKRASGMWQFMPSTGEVYGLKIDTYVDERRDLVKSTRAAVKYLSNLHEKFCKWYNAAMAYNCGEGRVGRAIKRAGTDDLNVLLSNKKHYLPRESRLYIRKIVALALLGSDESFLINREYDYLLNRANAYSLATVELPKGETLKRVAAILDMPHDDLKRLNRHLNYDFVPPYAESYDVYIPFVKYAEFKQKYKPGNLQKVFLVHTVTQGDNLSKLGKKYKVPYQVIKDFNNLSNNMLSLKQKLVIPVPKPSAESNKNYRVKQGDTLISIAKQFHVSVEEIKQLNRLKTNTIRIGETLSLYD